MFGCVLDWDFDKKCVIVSLNPELVAERKAVETQKEKQKRVNFTYSTRWLVCSTMKIMLHVTRLFFSTNQSINRDLVNCVFRARSSLRVLTLSSLGLPVISSVRLIGCCDKFSFGLRELSQNALFLPNSRNHFRGKFIAARREDCWSDLESWKNLLLRCHFVKLSSNFVYLMV